MNEESKFPPAPDLVKRLRGSRIFKDGWYSEGDPVADRIEALERRVAELTEERDEHYARVASLIYSEKALTLLASEIRQWRDEYIDWKDRAEQAERRVTELEKGKRGWRDRALKAEERAERNEQDAARYGQLRIWIMLNAEPTALRAVNSTEEFDATIDKAMG